MDDEQVIDPEKTPRRPARARLTLAAKAVSHLAELDAREAARFLEDVQSSRAARILRAQPYGIVRQIFEHLAPDAAGAMLVAATTEETTTILEAVGLRAAADAFRAMRPQTRDAALANLSEERKHKLREHLAFPEGSAGRMMRTDVTTFQEGTKVRHVVAKLRHLAVKKGPPGYVYVVGAGNRLKGVLMMRDLLLARPDEAVEAVMKTGVTAVAPFADTETLSDLVRSRNLLAVPVADADGRLLGAVRASELADGGEAAAEDLQVIFGGGSDERVNSPAGFKVAQRLPWLYVNLLTAFLAGSVIALFEDLIARVAVLAIFLPVVAGQSGNAGTQTLAVLLRGLVMREVQPDDTRGVIVRETLVGFINGVAIGLVTGVIAWLWKGNAVLGGVVAGAMVCALGAAGFAGAAIPLLMKRFGLDPAQSSGIFLTTVTDIVSFFSMLAFASMLEGRLR
ncbi:MAG: magnesium transporter [Elusimicrobia bacterium CG1_02_63_36]|nr:MAG: magnesium transporter [Elusimicrobia bacterium CG1_02_63_36]